MSLFRRKLLAKRGGEDKPNLATVTEATFPFDAPNPTSMDCGIRANLQANKKYRIRMQADVNITKIYTNGGRNFRFGDGYLWRNIMMWGGHQGAVSGNYHIDMDDVYTLWHPIADYVFKFVPEKIIGTVHIYDVYITEV